MTPELSSMLGGQLNQSGAEALNAGGVPPFAELVEQAVTGTLDLSLRGVLNLGVNLFFEEFNQNARFIKQLLLLALFGALLKCLTDAFKHKAAGETGFYITYIMTAMLAFSSFQLTAGVLSGLVNGVSGVMEASVPLILSLTAISGQLAGAAVFQPFLFLSLSLITNFFSEIFIPALMAASALAVVNNLAGGALNKMTALIKNAAELALKGIVSVFAILLTLQRISAPIANNLALRLTRAAADAVPVVGGALVSAVDSVQVYAGAAKSGVLVALMIVLCVTVAVPLLKMLALMFTLKLAAAVAQPICDERVVNCVDQLGAYTALLTGAGALIAAACVYAATILLI